MKAHFFYILISFFLVGCAGYHFNTTNNPLIGYDIKSISVPMFVNRSVLPHMSGMMTKEIVMALKDFPGLKVINGDSSESDAVLLGIVESEDHYADVVQTTESAFTSGDKKIEQSIGRRTPFYYPSKTAYQLRLRIILIKRPSKEEIDFVTKNTLGFAKLHPKVVLEEEVPIQGSFSRVTSDSITTTSGGELNFVKNKGIFEKSLQDSCIQTAKNFKQVVLNAF